MITRSVLEELELFASEKKISLKEEIQDNITLMGDETLLMRLWINLVENAIAYTQEGGKIQVGLFKKRAQ